MIDWAQTVPGATHGIKETVTVTVHDAGALLQELSDHLLAQKGFAVATLNLDHVVKLRRIPDFRTAYLGHSHITADGNPVVWLCRLAGQDVSLVPGAELVVPVAEMAAQLDVPIALLGSTEDALEKAALALQAQIPQLKIAAKIAPPMGFDPKSEAAHDLIGTLDISGARLCFLALGAPKQEIFALEAMQRLPHMGFLSVGAGLDFLAGHQTRAPKLVRLLAAEWLWRLGSNPRRLAVRYRACIAILPALTLQALRARKYSEDSAI